MRRPLALAALLLTLAATGCGAKSEPGAGDTGTQARTCGSSSTTSPTPTTRASTPRRPPGSTTAPG